MQENKKPLDTIVSLLTNLEILSTIFPDWVNVYCTIIRLWYYSPAARNKPNTKAKQ